MPETVTVRTRLTRQQLTGELRKVPAVLSGRIGDTQHLASTWRAEFAYHLFDKISRSFFAKSNWGSDELGDKWDPLKPATIVARESRKLPKRKGQRGLLSDPQNKLWKRIFASNYARLAVRVGDREAKERAAKMAWAAVKAAGGKTMKEEFANRRPLMNWISGRLKKSLMPGRRSAEGYVPPPEQVMEEYHGFLLLGSAVPYADYVHRKRRLWPSLDKMGVWISEAIEKAVQVIIRRFGSV